MKPRHGVLIHFVCTGNTYRSRLAEAYLNSKKVPGVTATSSGVEAYQNNNGPIVWYSQRIAKRYGLIPFMKPGWTQTTPGHFISADIIVFMYPKHLEKSRAMFGFDSDNRLVWEIPDLSDQGFTSVTDDPDSDLQRIFATEETFTEIRKRVDDLVDSIIQTGALGETGKKPGKSR
ncbi:hypothetical protein A2Z33_02430 [Candidatus Gottesmanbacteria bacterium RBG_16_52_11]|uniref:Phosphotyrosine protein phosphatase I domain-containing protein n=1 Tax=Candidatus Gottesmanbacteria bacterium RBG_16_52_11 TaxID=1798374 RepID=A0A1F5YMH2_9BACT|nr:MAG: hypothetical protein A2Z33_02430 [Candidatus Gottesmanbacteria bacterium RBG_16_52_11]